MRDAEDILLKTLRVVLAEETDVPSGRIWLKRPAEQFVKKQDGPNAPLVNPEEYPAIGINYAYGARFKYNNYGDTYTIDNGDDTSTDYKPIGELHLTLGIHLFTVSRKEQREIGTQIYMSLLKNKQIITRDDVLDDESFRVELITQQDLPGFTPYQEVFVVKTLIKVYEESTAATVLQVEVGLGMEEGKEPEDITVVPFSTTTATGTIFH